MPKEKNIFKVLITSELYKNAKKEITMGLEKLVKCY